MSLLIWQYVLGHCPTERLNDDSSELFWKRALEFYSECPGVSKIK